MASSSQKAQNGRKSTKEPFEQFIARNGKKWFIRLGAVALLVIAIFESYVQIRTVALHYGRPMLNASLLPISLDVFGVISAFKSRESGITRIARAIARICMWSAIGISLMLNLQAGILTSTGLTGIDLAWSLGISAIPAFCVLGLSEMLTHTHKGATPTRAKNGLAGLLGRIVTKKPEPTKATKAAIPTQRTSSTKTAKSTKGTTTPELAVASQSA